MIRTLKFTLRYNDTQPTPRGRHGKPIPESRPARRAFNTPNAAGVSRDTDAGPN